MKLDSTDRWMLQKGLENKKRNIYHAYSEYILFLKESLSYCENDSEKFRIESEIKKLEKAQRQFLVPSLLEERKETSVSSSRAKSMLKCLNPFQQN